MPSRLVNLLHTSNWKFTPYQILTAGFAALILTGTFLLTMPAASANGTGLNFVDALFTATSASCVIGLCVVNTATYFSTFGHLVIITLIQIGGVGIITMAVLFSIIVHKKILLRERLIMQEALNQLTLAGIIRLTKYICYATLGVEFLGGTLLAAIWYGEYGLKGIYFGYWHAVSAFCNAGFALFEDSMMGYADHFAVNLVLAALIILGGIGFNVYLDIWHRRKFDRLSLHAKAVIVTTLILIVIGAVGFFLLEFQNMKTLGSLSMKGKILASWFQSVSARTTGFNSVSVAGLTDATLFLLIALMFIGAAPTSTGGGIKTTTAAVMFALISSRVTGKEHVELFRRKIPQEIVYKAFAVFVISVFWVGFVTMMLTITENAPFLKLLFEVTSAFGTTGFSVDLTPTLTTAGKFWIILTMFSGRVGILTLVLSLTLRNRPDLISYPEEKLIIG